MASFSLPYNIDVLSFNDLFLAGTDVDTLATRLFATTDEMKKNEEVG